MYSIITMVVYETSCLNQRGIFDKYDQYNYTWLCLKYIILSTLYEKKLLSIQNDVLIFRRNEKNIYQFFLFYQ